MYRLVANVEPSFEVWADMMFGDIISRLSEAAERGDHGTMSLILSRVSTTDASVGVKKKIYELRSAVVVSVMNDAAEAAVKGDYENVRRLLAQIPIATAPIEVKKRVSEIYRIAVDRAASRRSRPAAPSSRAAGRYSPQQIAQLHDRVLRDQENGEYGHALRIMDRLIMDRPADAELRNDRGVVNVLAGRPQDARGDFRAAMRIDPGRPSPYLSLAAISAGQGKNKHALDLYETALAKACYPVDRQICRLMGAGPVCFLYDAGVCGLIAEEREALLSRMKVEGRKTD